MSEEGQIILPDGFKRVEYLQSFGTQWIDTGIIPNNETGLYLKAHRINGGDLVPAGARTNDIRFYPPRFNMNSTTIEYGWENYYVLGNRNTSDNLSYESWLNFCNSRKVSIQTQSNFYENILNSSLSSLSHAIYIFDWNNNGSATTHWAGKIYEVKISQGKNIVRHFIPCLGYDNEPCMYDLISKQPFYNQGSGQFNYPKYYSSSNYNLPAGFKKCVYLQSDGTQWIDTGVIPNNETGLYFNALQLSYGNLVPFGVTDGGNEIYPPRFASKNLWYRWGSSAVTMMSWDKAGDLIFHSSLNLYNSKIAKFDSEDTDVEMYITSQTGTYTLPIWLFSYNYRGSYNSTYGKWIGRVYRAQITQGYALIHDYVPCLDTNGRPCMYDIIGGGTVEDNTYYNQSGGTEFAYCVEHQLPSDFIKLKYLESDGTQYIKTGYVPTNTTGLYIDTQDVGSGDTIPMGLRESSSTNTRFFITRQTSSATVGYGWGTWTQISSTTKESVRYDSTLNWFNDRKSITNNPLFATVIKNLSDLSFTPTLDIWMFGINQGGSHAYNFKGRIYRAKISEGDQIVKDFVPAWDERKSKPCMYDLINNVAYYNDGEGEFLHNRDFEGNYKGFTGLGCIGNRLGYNDDPNGQVALPMGYIKCDFLESTGSQYIKTGLKANKLNSVVLFSPISSKNEGSGNYYLGCYNRNSNYQIGCQSNSTAPTQGTHVMLTISSTTYDVLQRVEPYTICRGEINFDEAFIKINDKMISIPENTQYPYPDTTVYLFGQNTVGASNNSTGGVQNIPSGRIFSFNGNYNGISAANYIPAIDSNGIPCMYDTVTERPLYNNGSGQFIVGIKTLSQAVSLRLPNNGGTITLSLPTNDKTEYYEEKIRANNPNWTITFQYH